MTEQAPADEPILETARKNPENVDIDKVVALFDADQSEVRNVALKCLIHVARDDPDRVVEVVDDVIERLDDDFPVAGSTATAVLAKVSKAHPDAVVPAIPKLIRKLDENPPLTGYRAATALAPLLEHAPEEFVSDTDYLLDVLIDPPEVWTPSQEELKELPDKEREGLVNLLKSRRSEIQKDTARASGIREFSAHALVEIAELQPEAVAGRVGELETALPNDPPLARAATIDVIATVARDDPAAVQSTVDALIERLDDRIEFVRVHAVRALGFAEATAAIEPLRELSEDDDVDEDVRELAAETADWLAQLD